MSTRTMSTYHLIPDIDDFNEDIDDVDQGVQDYIWNKRRALFVATCAGSAAVCGGLWGLEFAYYGEFLPHLGARIFWYPAAVLLCPVALYLYFRAQLQHVFMQQLARAIGFRYQPTGSLRALHGKIFELGTWPGIDDVLSGVYRGRPLEIFNYHFTIQQGRSSHTEHYTIFALIFDGTLPDIALAPKSFLAAGSLASAPDGDIEIILEGDFNEHFYLYAPKTFEVEIREIFQPDLMAELVAKYPAYRLEIAGNGMYVVGPPICNKARFLAAHDLIDHLFDRMVPKLKAVASERAPA
jgi:hypothetical protein